MTSTTPKTVVPARLVDRMTRHYGTIEAARDAYRAAKAVMRKDSLRGGEVLRVNAFGAIVREASCDVFYRGSVDAYDVIPS